MITIKNYFKEVSNIDYKKLPADLKENYNYMKEVTEDYTTWDYYNETEEAQEVLDKYLADLNEFLSKKRIPKKPSLKQSDEQNKEAYFKVYDAFYPYVKRGDGCEYTKSGQMGKANKEIHFSMKGNQIIVTEFKGQKFNYSFDFKKLFDDIKADVEKEKPAPKPRTAKKKTGPKPKIKTNTGTTKKETETKKQERKIEYVERISDEVRFIKRFALMNDKIKSPQQIRSFIVALQKAIIEKRIRKTSVYAKHINFIQEALIKFYNLNKKDKLVEIEPKIVEHFKEIASSQKLYTSTNYLKRFVGIQGRSFDKQKAIGLYNLIEKAIANKQIQSYDPYRSRIKNVLESLKQFISSAKKDETIEVHQSILNGLNGALDGCGCDEGVNGLGKPVGNLANVDVVHDSPEVMSSLEFKKMKFNPLGFTGKWKNLIGDPNRGFAAMIFGKPKLGKSYLAIDFAGYLAQNFGKVLYVSKEEGFNLTLQQKIDEKNAEHKDLFIANDYPVDLTPYDFVFFDSATRLNMKPEDISKFKTEYPDKSFVFVFQSTKDGNFRGSQAFEHDVDIIIEVYELGKARQNGRYNQGGEMDIFEDYQDEDFKIAA